MGTVRRDPKPLSYDDAGLAARMLARLPDTGGGALAALAWATANMWRAIHEGENKVKFPILMLTKHLLEHCEADRLPAKCATAASKWSAVSALAAALARDGDDPSGAARLFHHGSSAPDWALDREQPLWIGKWAFYLTGDAA